MLQYLSALLLRNVLPYLTITKNVETHARPMNAADTKQFWYPMFVTQGVMLQRISGVFRKTVETYA